MLVLHLFLMLFSFIIAMFLAIDLILEDDCNNKKAIVCLFSFCLFIFLAIFVSIGECKLSKEKWTIPNKKPYAIEQIGCLNDNNQINGQFYLRRGYIEEVMYYQYMVKMTDGGYVYNKVKANSSTIYTSDDNFRVEWYKEERKWLYFKDKRTICKIYIPKGCIEEKYNIDLE